MTNQDEIQPFTKKKYWFRFFWYHSLILDFVYAHRAGWNGQIGSIWLPWKIFVYAVLFWAKKVSEITLCVCSHVVILKLLNESFIWAQNCFAPSISWLSINKIERSRTYGIPCIKQYTYGSDKSRQIRQIIIIFHQIYTLSIISYHLKC